MRAKGPRPDKVEAVAGLADALASSKGAILTNYRGLTVAEITNLRKKLREVGAEYHVTKNTLLRRALGDQLTPDLDALLHGPTGVAFALEDAVPTAKAVLDFLRDLKKPDITVKGAFVDGRTYTPDQVTALSKVPPRPVVLGQVLGTIQAPLTDFAGTMNAVLSEFARTLQALADQRQAAAA